MRERGLREEGQIIKRAKYSSNDEEEQLAPYIPTKQDDDGKVEKCNIIGRDVGDKLGIAIEALGNKGDIRQELKSDRMKGYVVE